MCGSDSEWGWRCHWYRSLRNGPSRYGLAGSVMPWLRFLFPPHLAGPGQTMMVAMVMAVAEVMRVFVVRMFRCSLGMCRASQRMMRHGGGPRATSRLCCGDVGGVCAFVRGNGVSDGWGRWTLCREKIWPVPPFDYKVRNSLTCLCEFSSWARQS